MCHGISVPDMHNRQQCREHDAVLQCRTGFQSVFEQRWLGYPMPRTRAHCSPVLKGLHSPRCSMLDTRQECFLWSLHQHSHTTEKSMQIPWSFFCFKLIFATRTGTCGYDNARNLPRIPCKSDILLKGIWIPTQKWHNIEDVCALDHFLWNISLWLRRQHLFFCLHLALGCA